MEFHFALSCAKPQAEPIGVQTASAPWLMPGVMKVLIGLDVPLRHVGIHRDP
jgi:hypothetical protein